MGLLDRWRAPSPESEIATQQTAIEEGGAAALLASEPRLPAESPATLLRIARSNELVESCLSYRQQSVLDAPLRVVGDDGEEVESGALYDLLQEPALGMDSSEWMTEFVSDADIFGSVYLYRMRLSELGPPEGYFLLPPERVEIERGRGGAIQYVYTVDGRRTTFSSGEVAHFRIPDPANQWYGRGPVAKLLRIATLDSAATDGTLSFIQNAFIAAGIIKSDTPLSRFELGELRRAIRATISGSKKGEVVVFPSSVAFEPLSHIDSPEEEAVRTLSETRVTGVFGMHPILVGAAAGIRMSSGRNEYQTAERQFWRMTMKPLYTRIGLFLSRVFEADFGQRVEFDLSGVEALQDTATRETRAQWMQAAGLISVNEARVAAGQAPIDDPRADEIPSLAQPDAVATMQSLRAETRKLSGRIGNLEAAARAGGEA